MKSTCVISIQNVNVLMRSTNWNLPWFIHQSQNRFGHICVRRPHPDDDNSIKALTLNVGLFNVLCSSPLISFNRIWHWAICTFLRLTLQVYWFSCWCSLSPEAFIISSAIWKEGKKWGKKWMIKYAPSISLWYYVFSSSFLRVFVQSKVFVMIEYIRIFQ